MHDTAHPGPDDSDDGVLATPIPEITLIVARARHIAAGGALRDLALRRECLHRLRRLLVDDESRFADALAADLGKSTFESYVSEIGYVLNEIDHADKHLEGWARPRKVKLPLHQRPGSATITPRPLGAALIIAPWNYPLQLVLAPIVAALAAGNAVVVKPSELAPATARVLTDIVGGAFPDGEVQFVNGAVPETTALLDEKFDHVFYTGNGTVGRIVMAAAAKHLTPVTLELGGKSPAIVAADADIDVAARRIVWGKFLNVGQTCVAPDHVLVERPVADRLQQALARSVRDFFGDDPSASDDYGRIVNDRHVARIAELLDGHGGAVVVGGEVDVERRYIAPTIVRDAAPDSALMTDEIFGPVLPVQTVESIDEAIGHVNGRPHPLALYVFSDDDSTADRVIEQTIAGGVTVNHTLMHLAVSDLPFGGVGESGIGAYHGETGFRRFSHMQPVLRRGTRLDPSAAYPPYSGLVQRVLRKVL